MNPEQSQPTGQLLDTKPAPQMQPDEAAASLAFATNFQTQLMQHKASQNKPQDTGKTDPNSDKGETKPSDTKETQDPQKEIEAVKVEFEKKIEDMKKSITDEIKADIKEALANEQD